MNGWVKWWRWRTRYRCRCSDHQERDPQRQRNSNVVELEKVVFKLLKQRIIMKKNYVKRKGCIQHQGFPSGPPRKYWLGPIPFNFWVLMVSGALGMVWSNAERAASTTKFDRPNAITIAFDWRRAKWNQTQPFSPTLKTFRRIQNGNEIEKENKQTMNEKKNRQDFFAPARHDVQRPESTDLWMFRTFWPRGQQRVISAHSSESRIRLQIIR